MYHILSKIELDISQANELPEAVELAVKYQIPALVVHPALANQLTVLTYTRQGKYKIITQVDWPKGENYGPRKLQGLNVDAITTEGFEFLLTPGKKPGETQNEIKMIAEFVRSHVAPVSEVRFVLNAMSRNNFNVRAACEGMRNIPLPAFVRLDTATKMQVTKANPDVHNQLIKTIKGIIDIPVKVSGNVNSVRAITGCPKAARFAASLAQMKEILKELQRQPTELQEVLGTPEAQREPTNLQGAGT